MTDLQILHRLQGEEGNTQYVGTQLGLAVLASGLSPDEGLHVFSELHRARKCFVLENELHIVYQVIQHFATLRIIHEKMHKVYVILIISTYFK